LDFWRAYDAEYAQVSRELAEAFAARPSHERVLGTADVAAAREETHSLVRRGVNEDDWSEYEERIRRAAAQLARDGVSFDHWHVIIRTLHDGVSARLVMAFADDAPRLNAALHAMRRFWDQELAVIAAEFISAKESVLRDGAALDKKFSTEEDRTRIAREMHDELGQPLTALKFDLGWLLRRHDRHARTDVGERLHAMIKLVDETLETVHSIAKRLRVPDMLDGRGLVDALASEARKVETRSSLHFHLLSPRGKDFRVPVEPARGIFAAFQEILSNVVRHADAKNVHVRLERTAGGLRLEVEDDGRGIPLARMEAEGSLGLVGVRERISLLGGTFDLERKNGRGTCVRISVPFEQGATA
jgi:signal transduction histidine kinase